MQKEIQKEDYLKTIQTIFNSPNNGFGLDPYSGEWNFDKAAHLLRRATYAPSQEDILQAVEDGLATTLDRLFMDRPLPTPPINYYYESDAYVPIGATWVSSPYDKNSGSIGHRNKSLQAWLIKNFMEEGVSIREKMTFFWHNHFGCQLVNDPIYVYRYNTLLRINALGNFKEIVKKVAVEPLMLTFLDGSVNTAENPNENFARELLEIYTVGKGPTVGPGDYTTFTETDVREIARIMTGWVAHGFQSRHEEITAHASFWLTRHDRGKKQLSHRFNNTEIGDEGDLEVFHLIDIIFQQRIVALNICRKLFRYFVYCEITELQEELIIEPLADYMIANDYEVEPVIRLLLSSEHFFNDIFRGGLIKNPIEYSISILKLLEVTFPEDTLSCYQAYKFTYQFLLTMGMEILKPPEVPGWEAYYRGPAFQRLWLNTSTLAARNNFVFNLTKSSFDLGDFSLRMNPFEMLEKTSDELDPNTIVGEITKLLLPHQATGVQFKVLKESLLNGLLDVEWKIQYSEYMENPATSGLEGSLKAKLGKFLHRVLNMAEFHLN